MSTDEHVLNELKAELAATKKALFAMQKERDQLYEQVTRQLAEPAGGDTAFLVMIAGVIEAARITAEAKPE